MPSRNIVKEYGSDSFYHAYNRGVEKRKIFLDDQDYGMFLHILKRYLDPSPQKDRSGRQYKHHENVELLAFCLMPNHFHLFLRQGNEPTAMTELLHSVSVAYTMYFNRKYRRTGHLFQDRFKASRITSEAYFWHISRYIHLNPSKPFEYEWSSLPYYLGNKRAKWLHPEIILNMFDGHHDYRKFVADYEGHKAELDKLKGELANDL